MPTVLGYRDVKDADHCLASLEREEFLGPLRLTNILTSVDLEQGTRAGVSMDSSLV